MGGRRFGVGDYVHVKVPKKMFGQVNQVGVVQVIIEWEDRTSTRVRHDHPCIDVVLGDTAEVARAKLRR